MKNAITDALIITKRQLLQLARVPEVLIFSTIQPVMFVLLFRFVFGGSISTGQPGGYVQLLIMEKLLPAELQMHLRAKLAESV